MHGFDNGLVVAIGGNVVLQESDDKTAVSTGFSKTMEVKIRSNS